METLLSNPQARLKRNKCDDSPIRKKERNWFGGDGNGKPKPKCIYCSGEHWSDECKTVVSRDQRKKLFVDKNLFSIVGELDTEGLSAAVKVASSAVRSIIPVYVIKGKIQNLGWEEYSMLIAGLTMEIHCQHYSS